MNLSHWLYNRWNQQECCHSWEHRSDRRYSKS